MSHVTIVCPIHWRVYQGFSLPAHIINQAHLC